MHRRAIRRVLRAPMSFLDTTPIGQILNRFSQVRPIDRLLLPGPTPHPVSAPSDSRIACLFPLSALPSLLQDVNSLDVDLPTNLEMFLITWSRVMDVVIVACVPQPYFALALLPLFVAFHFVKELYR